MQSRALPFNGAVGCLALVGQPITLTATNQNILFSNLNLQADSTYEIEFSLKDASASAAVIDLFVNGDTTATNYWRSLRTTTNAATQNSGSFAQYVAGGTITGRIRIVIDAAGVATASISARSGVPSSITPWLVEWSYTIAGNITSINLRHSAAAGFAIGSWARLYKKSPLIALNNAANLDVTANPSNPVHLQRVRRVDAATIAAFGAPVWICYDATLGKWLTEEEYSQVLTMWSNSLTGSFDYYTAARNDYQMYATRLSCKTYVQTTNNGSNRWTLTLNARDSAIASTAVASVNTGATPDAANTVINHDQVINALVPAGTMLFTMVVVKVGAPGNLVAGNSLFYRLVIP